MVSNYPVMKQTIFSIETAIVTWDHIESVPILKLLPVIQLLVLTIIFSMEFVEDFQGNPMDLP
jgi:hypothetical protein